MCAVFSQGFKKSCGFVNILLIIFLEMGTAHKMKFSINHFFSKCDQIRKKLRIWSHLLKKSLMENFNFCVLLVLKVLVLKDFYLNLKNISLLLNVISTFSNLVKHDVKNNDVVSTLSDVVDITLK